MVEIRWWPHHPVAVSADGGDDDDDGTSIGSCSSWCRVLVNGGNGVMTLSFGNRGEPCRRVPGERSRHKGPGWGRRVGVGTCGCRLLPVDSMVISEMRIVEVLGDCLATPPKF